jgi:Ca-activated chloride channel family protein
MPDTLVLDPDLKYDLVVHTIPPQVKKDIAIIRGKHNIINVDAPQGFLKLELDGTIGQYNPTTLIRKGTDMKTLNVQEFGKKEKYIVGKYDLEVLTFPRVVLKDVEIKQSSVNTIKIPASGSTTFIKQGGTGHGSIYTDDGKTVVWVCNLNSALQNEIIYLQPGKYKVVFRYEFARETLQTIQRNFEVKAGLPQTVRLF